MQCNCEAYARRTPVRRETGITARCPGAAFSAAATARFGAAGARLAALADPTAFAAPLGILYNVTWFPNTPEALANVPKPIRTLAAKAPGCKPRSWSAQTPPTARRARAPPRVDLAVGNRSECGRVEDERLCRRRGRAPDGGRPARRRRERVGGGQPARSGERVGRKRPRVTVAWSHPFKLHRRRGVRRPLSCAHRAWAVDDDGDVTATTRPPRDSIPRYGDKEGIVGDEAGFIADIPQ